MTPEERLQQAGDAARLLKDIRSIQDPVATVAVARANGELPGPLLERLTRERGWDEDRLRAALVAIRNGTTGDVRLSKNEHRRLLTERVARTASAGAGVSATRSRPSSSPNRTGRDLMGMAGNIAAARASELDPSKLWPGQVGLPGRPSASWLVAAAGLELPAAVDPAPVEHRTGAGWSNSPQPANRRGPGGRAPRRRGGR